MPASALSVSRNDLCGITSVIVRFRSPAGAYRLQAVVCNSASPTLARVGQGSPSNQQHCSNILSLKFLICRIFERVVNSVRMQMVTIAAIRGSLKRR